MEGQALLVPFGGAGHPGDCQKEPAQQGGTNA